MDFRNDVNKIMKNVQVDYEITDGILNSTTRKNKIRGFSAKRVVVVAMAAVICLGTMVVGASEISKLWDATVAKMYNTSEKLREKLVEEDYADVMQSKANSDNVLTVEKDGVIVSVKQTLADKYGLYIYLDVKLTDGSKFPGGWYFKKTQISINGDNKFYLNSSAGMVEYEYDISECEAGYTLYFVNSNEVVEDIAGKEIHLSLSELIGQNSVDEDEKVLATGDWDFYWKVKSNSTVKTINLNNSYEVYKLKKLEISPLSICLSYDSNENDSVERIIPFKIVMNDGKVYSRLSENAADTSFGRRGYKDNKREVVMFKDYILDIDNIEYVEVAGTRYEVE